MGGILGGGSNAKQQRAVGSLQFQTSQAGGVIPLIYGTTKVSPNLLDYDDFTATASKQGGGKGKGGGGGKGGGHQYMYSASFIMGLCQGPIAGLGLAWWDKNIRTTTGLPSISSINLGDVGQPIDLYWSGAHPAKALGYSGTAHIVFANYQLGNTATLPNFNFEVIGIGAGAAGASPNGYDANPAQIITDFLTNPRYGANFPSGNLDPDHSVANAFTVASFAGAPAQTGGDTLSLIFTDPSFNGGSPYTVTYTTSTNLQMPGAMGGLAHAVNSDPNLVEYGFLAAGVGLSGV